MKKVSNPKQIRMETHNLRPKNEVFLVKGERKDIVGEVEGLD